jgi:3-oxoacyl-[acyl-carrier protein] reductase
MSVVITGGGSGIGAGAAKHFAERGAMVTICGRRKEKVEEVRNSIGDSCCSIVADVTRPADRRRLIDSAIAHAGKIDALIHAAGNLYRKPLGSIEQERLAELYNSNVIAPVMLTQLALPHLRQTGGSVVFFGSVHVKLASVGASSYAGTKAALETLTGSLAAELGPLGIRVNCVRPGAVPSELNERGGYLDAQAAAERLEAIGRTHPLGRVGTPEEISEAIEYLVRAEWTTGSVVVVDGGRSVGMTGT